MHRVLVLAAGAAVAMLAAAPPGAATTRQATQGVTKDEVTVGVTYPDLEAIRDVVNLDHGNYETAYEAVVDDLNKRGGVNGRKVALVFAPVNPIGTSAAEQACVKLADDDQSFAVMGFFNNDAPLCYVEQHGIPVVGGNITGEYLARAKAPWYSPNAGDETVSQLIDALAADGQLKPAKVGVIAAAGQKGLTEDVVLPALKRSKVKAEVAYIDVAADDVVAAQQQSGVIAERFKSSGVDTVVVVGNAFQTFATALEKTDYRPKLLATDREVYLGYVSDPTHSKAVLEGAVSGGPARDFDEPGYVKCRQLVEKAIGTTIPDAQSVAKGDPQIEVSALNACTNTAVFAAVAEAAGKNLTLSSFGKAGAKLGPVELPGYGTVTYDPKAKSFSLPVKLTRFDAATDKSVQDDEAIPAER